MENIFTSSFLKSIGFKLVKSENGYGHAIDIKTNGMTHIRWNIDGPNMTYFRENFDKPSAYFEIRKDGDTRYAFNGYIFNEEDVRNVLRLTW